MSSIITFYSYKGGVGRSMGLANIAVLLARRGLKVLVVDWDLEAPGLERYFSYFEIRPGGPGLLRMCMEARDRGTTDYTSFTSSFDCRGTHPVTLLASGRAEDESYTRNLESFDWEAFYSATGGAFVEELRERWRTDFDVTLIDSRTGLSDTGGICTIQLPDIVVGMFTANLQSLYGVRDVMRLAQRARQSLAYDRMPLTVLPLATRWGVQEFQETQVWLDRIAEATKEFFDDWLPREVLPRDVLEAVKIPQVAYFSFGERLAVEEQSVSDPQGMGFVYDKVAAFIASDFRDLDALIGPQKAAARARESVTTAKPPKQAQTDDYLFDIFVSYDTSMSEWVLEFIDRLKTHLTTMRREPPRIFIDLQELRVGDVWPEKLGESLLRSKVMLAFVTPRYVASTYAIHEFRAFSERSRLTKKSLLFPVLLRSAEVPDFIRDVLWFDLRESLQQGTTRGRELEPHVQTVAKRLDQLLNAAPDFDPSWAAISESVYRQPTGITKRLNDALEHHKFKWRPLERIAAEAGVTESVASEQLRAMPSVKFSKGKSGRIIVGLASRVK